MNTKEIEIQGYKAFEDYLNKFYSGRFDIEACMNKGQHSEIVGCDAILKLDGKDEKYYIELKASTSARLVSNIRFTHQTLATMKNAGVIDKMIVVYVYNLGRDEEPKFKFFRFGDFPQDKIVVEPHFIIQLNKSAKNVSNEFEGGSPIKDKLDDVLSANLQPNDISKLFETKVSQHMKLKSSDRTRPDVAK